MPIVCFQYRYGLKPVPLREQRRTSGAKAHIIPAIYGTAEAVRFVQSCFAVGREHSGVERSAVSFRFSQTLCYKTPSIQTCMPQRVQRVCENRKRNSSGENSSSSKGIIAASPIPAKAVSCGPRTCFTSGLHPPTYLRSPRHLWRKERNSSTEANLWLLPESTSSTDPSNLPPTGWAS
jgi:hypothetical protein